jgi:hypothetical protein
VVAIVAEPARIDKQGVTETAWMMARSGRANFTPDLPDICAAGMKVKSHSLNHRTLEQFAFDEQTGTSRAICQ